MKLVIDIDDEQVLFDIKNRCLKAETDTDKVIINAIYNGIPLKTGKWINDTLTGFKVVCSECGARNIGADRAYCPRCGRQMKEDNDD